MPVLLLLLRNDLQYSKVLFISGSVTIGMLLLRILNGNYAYYLQQSKKFYWYHSLINEADMMTDIKIVLIIIV